MLEWAIVGGGIHGTHLSHVLVDVAGVPRGALRVIDAHTRPLAVWRRQTAACGMRFLRSPAAHNLAASAHDLLRRADQPDELAGPYRRPSLALFDRHCDDLIAEHALDTLRVTGYVETIEALPGGYRLAGPGLALRARRVVLAPGQPPLRYPAWARGAPATRHVFEGGRIPAGPVCVVGAGLSGAQTALTLADGNRPVTLLSRDAPRVAEFDADPCYLGPKCLDAFHAEADPAARRALIRRARRPGSLPEAVHTDLRAAVAAGAIDHLRGEAVRRTAGSLILADGRRIAAGTVLLATGFEERPPAEALVAALARRWNLPRCDDGFPLTGADLQWRPGLFPVGRLAELSLGPAAGNIAGARMAGRRLAAYCRDG